ncbi:MAG TPA: DinB family protein [Luteimonas sp.]|nr:DinB family protein [Luteimonas sp.]
MNETLQRLFRYKAWANAALLDRLAALGENSAVTALARKALAHSHVVDRIFAAHLRRQPHAYASANPDELPTLAALSTAMRANDREYVEYVSTLDRAQLEERIDFAFIDGAAGRMSREEMLLHVITHGIGHRGQVSAVMLFDSVPPAKDGFTTYLHEAEAAERRRAA